MSAQRILVVDDNRDLAENLVEILESAGLDADCFDSPDEALEATRPGRYKVAVVDIRMPRTDGVELYTLLRKIDPGLRGIAMTAFARDERVQAALGAGITQVMNKPLDPMRLIDQVQTLLVA